MFRMSGYFLLGSKSGGFCTQVSIFLPSKLVYQISSGSLSFSCDINLSFTCVSCFVLPLASATKMSVIVVGVDITNANVEPSCDAVKEKMSCLPLVMGDGLPVAASKR